MRFRNFIFDLDGTLVDSFPGIQAAFDYSWGMLFTDQPVPEIHEDIGPPIKVVFEKKLPSAPAEQINQLVYHFREAYDGWCWEFTKLYDDVPGFLQSLKTNHCLCFGVTNKPTTPTTNILKRLGILEAFVEFVSPDSPGRFFEDKSEAIRSLIALYSLKSEKTAFIGDSNEDAMASYKNGIAFFHRINYSIIQSHLSFDILHQFTDLKECESWIEPLDVSAK